MYGGYGEMAEKVIEWDMSQVKSYHMTQKTRDRDFEPFWIWAISIFHAYDFTWDMSHSITFSAISPV